MSLWSGVSEWADNLVTNEYYNYGYASELIK